MINFIRRKLHNLVSDARFLEILTGSVWALSARVVATGLGLVTSIISARVYEGEIMGIVAVLQSALLPATIFAILCAET